MEVFPAVGKTQREERFNDKRYAEIGTKIVNPREPYMKKIEIYTKDHCPYCHRAKGLLQSKNAEFTDHDLTIDPAKEQEMRQRSGRTSVPEIFIDDHLIGGCDDLFALDAAGKLEEALGI